MARPRTRPPTEFDPTDSEPLLIREFDGLADLLEDLIAVPERARRAMKESALSR